LMISLSMVCKRIANLTEKGIMWGRAENTKERTGQERRHWGCGKFLYYNIKTLDFLGVFILCLKYHDKSPGIYTKTAQI
jgi:hypothetical protein